jgi:hypothetical protein
VLNLHLPNITPARLDREFDAVTLSEIVKAGLGDVLGGDEDVVAIDINPAQNPQHGGTIFPRTFQNLPRSMD